MIAVAALTTCVAAAALRPDGSDGAVVPGRWSRTAGAALTGAGLGALLVGDPTVGWTAGAVPALALLPSAAGGLWAGHYLWRLADAFPRALSGVPACGGGAPVRPRARLDAARGGRPARRGSPPPAPRHWS